MVIRSKISNMIIIKYYDFIKINYLLKINGNELIIIVNEISSLNYNYFT